ncbi:hypothetical protein ACWDSL_09660 [Streptomyces sp. NPDC000941]
MLGKRSAAFAALATTGVLLLTACGGGDDSAQNSKASQASQTSKAPQSSQKTSESERSSAASGAMDLSFRSGTAKQGGAAPKTGDWAGSGTPKARKWVQLSAGRAGALNPVVVNGAGFTLYRFDKDTAMPSKSNCEGACATTWPPVLIAPGGKIFVDGVKPSAIGVIKRADGTRQVTINGWPVYRFSKDAKPGDTNGQGVGGTWFGVTPDGQKAGRPENNPAGSAPSGGTAKATSVILFDDAGFADNGAQGLAGPGCQNVARDDVASSLSADGSLKIWSGPDCTGRSKVVTGDVADLAAIGFDNDVSSVRFG